MPNHGKLALASGIAGGAEAFVQAFTQGKAQEHQEKMQKNMAVVQLLTEQLKDENLTGYQRAKILNVIPGLIGAKIDRPLDQILGNDKINDELIKSGTAPTPVNAALPSGSTHEELLKSVASSNPSQVDTINKDIMIKRGNLSRADLRLIQGNKADESEIAKQARLWEIKLNLEKKAAENTGYKVVSENILPNDQYELVFANDQGKIQRKILDGVPKSVAVAKLRGNNIPGKLGQLTRMHSIVSEYEADPTSHTQAEYDAAKDGLNQFERSGKLVEAQTEALNQGITGTKPPTIANKADDLRADTTQKLQIQKDIDETRANAKATFTAVQAANTEKKRALADKLQAEQDFTEIAKKWQPGDAAYGVANKKMEAARAHYNSLEEKFGALVAADNLAKEKAAGAISRASLLNSTQLSTYTPRQKAMIAEIRKNNSEAAANLTDEQIAAQILASKHKDKFK